MPLLSIIVPVYNEEATLELLIDSFMKAPCPIDREWIFIDDNSTDKSLTLLQSLAARYSFQVLAQETNLGKGSAVIRGIREARGDLVMIQDADFEYDPREIPQIIQPILDGKADVVYGSRFKHNSPQVHRTYHYFVNRLLTILSNLLSGIYLTDMETCYKVFRADLLKAMKLTSKRFGIEVEMTAYLAKTRARIYELPISYFPRTRLEGKKINWQDGVAALYHLLRFNCFRSPAECFDHLPDHYQPGDAHAPKAHAL
ncbi:MAG: glycosyltransferase family 2 protein [Elusimicrobiota bacterium]|jgi:glycosyltransferase involved in cell wall biosynthesis